MKPAELRKKVTSGSCPSLVCLYGEETWQRDQLLEHIIDRIVPPDARDFNFSQFQGRQAGGRDILEQIQT
ncbi:MAG: DNA polymerase III subunit delta, partial [Deltaproteobacteria bacterium]